ncbi:MAG: protein kinase [Alphaproteobacteria bacterium]|nr:protein kinase [Alphaproteobacteria bacterium]
MRRVGAYLLQAPLGQGAHGEVWRAVHEPTGSPVAVKLLHGTHRVYGDDLLREAQALAALTHPGIARVHDLGADDGEGSPWLVMELGEASLLERPPADTGALRDVLLQVLAALGHAHARGVLHRDLKPSNVVWIEGRPKLVDFGIAVMRGRDDTSDHAGTPLYVAPEQLRGEVDLLGPWTDLYALGWMTWELCTGQHPWAGREPWALVDAHLYREPPLWPDALSPELGDWVRRCLAKAPADRFRRAADAAWALLRVPFGDAPLGRLTSPPSTTFNFGGMAPLGPVPVGDGSLAPPTPTPPPWNERWEATERWEPEPLALAGLGLFSLRRIDVVGRRAERARLWAALGQAVGGVARAVTLRGSPGIGRTALARWLCERAHETGAATPVAVLPGSDGDPWVALRAAVGRALGRWGVPAGCAPETEEGLRALVDGAPLRDEVRWAVLADWLAATSARRPRILFVDDADRAPDLLAGLRAMQARGVGRTLIVVAVEPGTDPLDGEVLDLGPLDAEEGRQLVGRLLGLEDLQAVRLLERTSGHPAYTVQLVGDWVERGWLVPAARGFRLADGVVPTLPADLHAVWQARVARLELGALASDLRRLAIWESAGGAGDRRLWRALAGKGRALRERLWPMGWLVDRDGVPALSSGVLRDSLVRAAQEAGEAPGHHRACAELLAEDEPERRGLHLLRAGEHAAAAPLLLAAAREAMARGMLARAAEWVGLAADVVPPDDALVLEGRLAFLRAEYARCRDAMVPLAERATGAVRHEAALWAAQSLMLTGPASEADRWIQVAIEHAPTEEQASSARRTRAEVLILLGRMDEADALLEPLRRSPHPLIRAAAWHTSGSLARGRDAPEEAAALYARAAEEHAANRDRFREALARIGVATQLRRLERWDEAVAAFEEAIRMAAAIGSPDVDLGRLNLAWLQVDRGAPDLARPWFAICRRGFADIPMLEAVAVVGELTCAGAAGDEDRFDEDLARLRELLSPDVAPELVEIVDQALAAWKDRPARAEALRAAWSAVAPST